MTACVPVDAASAGVAGLATPLHRHAVSLLFEPTRRGLVGRGSKLQSSLLELAGAGCA